MIGLWESICLIVVDKLNADNVPQNPYDRYELGHWYGGIILQYHQAVIYHHGGRCTDVGWGAIAWTNANDKFTTYEQACQKLLHIFLKMQYNIEFSNISELKLKLALRGMSI